MHYLYSRGDSVKCNIFFTGPPTITYISDPQLTVKEGNKTSITCNATNDEDAVESLQIVWYNKDNVTISGQQDVIKSRDNITTELQSTISFDPVNRIDEGVYTCRAFNHPQSYIESKTEVNFECEETTLYPLPIYVFKNHQHYT